MAAVNTAHCSIIYNRKILGGIGVLWHPGRLESLFGWNTNTARCGVSFIILGLLLS